MRRPVAWLFALLLASMLPAAAQQPPQNPVLRIDPGMHTDSVRAVAAMPNGEVIATVSTDKTARLWRTDGALLRVLRPPIADGHEGVLNAVALSQERRVVVVGGATGAAWGRQAFAYIFSLDHERMQRLPTSVPAEITALAFAPGGQRLAIGFFGQAGVAVFDFASGDFMSAGQIGIRGSVQSLAFDPAGNLAVASGDGRIHLLDARLQPLRPARPLGEGMQPGEIAFSPDGRLLAVGGANMPVVRVLDGRTLEPRPAPPLPQALGRERQHLRAVAWSQAGGQLALLAAGYVLDPAGRSAVLRWQPWNQQRSTVWGVAQNAILSLAELPDGRVAYAAADPAWGVLDAGGRAVVQLERQGGDFRSIGAGLFRTRPDGTDFGLFPTAGPGSFRVSADAMVVEFGMQPGGRAALRFNARARSLEPVREGLPVPSPPVASLPLRDWMNGAAPHLGLERLGLSAGEVARSLALLPDGSGFLLGTDTHLRRFDISGRALDALPMPATVWGVQPSGDGRQAVLALGDGTLRWHDLVPGAGLAERAALFVHRDRRRWLLWTPEGFFDHSDSGGQDLAGFHLNNRAQDAAEWINFQQLYRIFHAEDLVRNRLARGEEATLRARLASIGNVRVLLSRAGPPQVAWQSLCFVEALGQPERCQELGGPQAATRGFGRLRDATRPASSAEAAPVTPGLTLPPGVDQVRLRAVIAERGGGVGQADLLLNERNVGRQAGTRGFGRPAATAAPAQPAAPGGTVEHSRTVTLEPGRNTLQLRVFDQGNDTFGQSAVLELWTAPARPVPRRPMLHVLAVGVDDYSATTEAGLRSLEAAAADARELSRMIERAVPGEYSGANVLLLTDAQATLPGIEQAFGRLRDEVRAEDTLLIYLAGHGLNHDDRYYFVPHMREQTDLPGAIAASLSDRRLVELWSALPARNTLLMLDTCHAGAFDMTFVGALQNETGRLVLAAASAQQEAADRVPGTRHGPFNLAVQEAFGGRVQRRMTAEGIDQLTLGFHVRERVPELARQARVPDQRVSFRLTNGELPSPFLLTRLSP